MTTWKDGSDYGRLCREITNEEGLRIICAVWVKRYSPGKRDVEPWPEGEANFRLILQAPQMLEALEAIARGAIISPDQSPERIAESALRVLQLTREENLKYLLLISTQQKRAEQAESQVSKTLKALEAIRDKADDMMEIRDGSVDWTDWQPVRSIANAAVAAVKGENDDNIG